MSTRENVAACILNFCTRWKGVVSFTPQPFYSRTRRPRYPFDRNVGVPHSRFGSCGKKKNLLTLLGVEPRLLDRPSPRLVAILFRLLNNASVACTKSMTILYSSVLFHGSNCYRADARRVRRSRMAFLPAILSEVLNFLCPKSLAFFRIFTYF
jgi:hypothetical protein